MIFKGVDKLIKNERDILETKNKSFVNVTKDEKIKGKGKNFYRYMVIDKIQ